MCLKCQKHGRKLVRLCSKAKTAKRKGIARNFFRHPLKISLPPPPGRNPETTPACNRYKRQLLYVFLKEHKVAKAHYLPLFGEYETLNT